MRQTASTAGNGNFIVQIQGDGNSIVTGLPHLELTRRHGIARRIEVDPSTGKPRETDVIRPFTRSIELVGRETELDDLRAWLRKESAISVRVLTGSAGYGKTRLAVGADRGDGAAGLVRRFPHAGGAEAVSSTA